MKNLIKQDIETLEKELTKINNRILMYSNRMKQLLSAKTAIILNLNKFRKKLDSQ